MAMQPSKLHLFFSIFKFPPCTHHKPYDYLPRMKKVVSGGICKCPDKSIGQPWTPIYGLFIQSLPWEHHCFTHCFDKKPPKRSILSVTHMEALASAHPQTESCCQSTRILLLSISCC